MVDAVATTNPTISTKSDDPIAGSIFVEKILEWGTTNTRQFPWRVTRDPFTVLIAEVMLQRTQAPQAARILIEFVNRYSDAEAVIREDPGTIESLLMGLGLRHRARRILDLCHALVDRHDGQVPSNSKELRALPGVGPYTTNAVLCFAFGRDVAIVDQNVVRVLTRVFGPSIRSARPRDDSGLWSLASSLLPLGLTRDYQFRLLDFASAICTSKTNHQDCPMVEICQHFLYAESGEKSLPKSE